MRQGTCACSKFQRVFYACGQSKKIISCKDKAFIITLNVLNKTKNKLTINLLIIFKSDILLKYTN